MVFSGNFVKKIESDSQKLSILPLRKTRNFNQLDN